MGWLTWSFQLLCLQLVVLHSVSCANLCSHDQSSALLRFKQLFSFYGCSYSCDSTFPKMKYWKEDTDCCSWDGVTCDMVTGHVIGLDLSCSCLNGTITSNSSLFLLPHLQNLNLAFNDFSGSSFPSDFGRLKSLTHLNLSSTWFSGPIPLAISHLSKLVSLDLSQIYTRFTHFMSPTPTLLTLETSVIKGLVQNMTDLEELVFRSGVNMSTIDPAYLTNLSSRLTLLDLQDCFLQGMFPENIFHLPNLQQVNLRNNIGLTGYLANWSSTLKYVDLSYTTLSGKLPYSFGNLKSLWYLDLTYCNFTGTIPTSIGNFSQLLHLRLSNNKFFGHIPSSLSNLEQLSILDLSSNSLDGIIPSRLFTLPFLEYIDLSSNQITGHIPEFRKIALIEINLSNNRLHGPIPYSIVELVNLTRLNLSSNNLDGMVELSMFANLKQISLSDNNLSTKIKVNSSFPRLYHLDCSACNIMEFAGIITADYLQTLDLSNNKIHGQIPNWLFNMSNLRLLDLSHNYLTGIEPLPWENLQMQNLAIVDLRSNLLQGQLPALPPSVQFFSVSHNNMIGAIPSSFCNLTDIAYLDLSNNSLYGSVPRCLGNSTTIQVLDLKRNNFHGSIPQTFAADSRLKTLNLNGNQMEGPLPLSLLNCRDLEVLDVGNNVINDTFPHWLAALSQLQVLILRSNRFHGPLGTSMGGHPFSTLRILDLSYNGFTGPLQSRFLAEFEAMSRKNNSDVLKYMGDDYYRDSIVVTMKGVEIEIQRILTIFAAMDLSSNKLQGRIPSTVGKLKSLKVLNFSHNNLIGHIPVSLENLSELESLDLSSNRFEGGIPVQLISLTSLSILNLSYNQLEGPIPSGKQFNTFQNDSYIGNSGLCGLPLSKKCSNNEEPELEPTKFHEEQDTSSWFDWKIITMGYGSGLVIGFSMGYVVFSTGKPWWFVSMVERKVLKLTGRSRRRTRRRN